MDAECAIGNLGAKLGFVRVGFNYFISDAVFEYILEAVHLLAEHAWKLLPLYRFDPASGVWRHRDARSAPTLADAQVPRVTPEPERALEGQLEDARHIFRAVEAAGPRAAESGPALSPEFERIRWFPLPREALALLASADAA